MQRDNYVSFPLRITEVRLENVKCIELEQHSGFVLFRCRNFGFRNDRAFVGNSDTSRKGCTGNAGSCTSRSYNSRSRIPMTVVTSFTRTALTAVCTLHYWEIKVRLPEVTHFSLLRPSLGATQPPVRWVPDLFFGGTVAEAWR